MKNAQFAFACTADGTAIPYASADSNDTIIIICYRQVHIDSTINTEPDDRRQGTGTCRNHKEDRFTLNDLRMYLITRIYKHHMVIYGIVPRHCRRRTSG